MTDTGIKELSFALQLVEAKQKLELLMANLATVLEDWAVILDAYELFEQNRATTIRSIREGLVKSTARLEQTRKALEA